jgi:hypothetical protein
MMGLPPLFMTVLQTAFWVMAADVVPLFTRVIWAKATPE